jgi:predicted component of type VI protein secretion system
MAIDFHAFLRDGTYRLLTIPRQSAAMIFNPDFAADGTPNDASLLAMRAALRDLKVTMRKPKAHPRRAKMLAILADARTRIDRINDDRNPG